MERENKDTAHARSAILALIAEQNDRKSLPTSVPALRAAVRLFVELSAGMTALLLAVGWPFVLMLYRSLGCDPADVGINGEWLLVRAAAGGIVLTIVALALVVLPVGLGRGALEWIIWSMAAVVAGADAGLRILGRPTLLPMIGIGAGIIGIAAFPTLGLVHTLKVHRPRRPLALAQSRLSAGLCLVCAGLMYLPWSASRFVSEQVKSGRSVDVDFGLGLSILAFDQRMVVASTRGPSAGLNGHCIFLIGASYGSTYLYEWRTQRAIIAPSQSLLLESDSRCD